MFDSNMKMPHERYHGGSITRFLPQTQDLYYSLVTGKVHGYLYYNYLSKYRSILYGHTWIAFVIVINPLTATGHPCDRNSGSTLTSIFSVFH